MTATATACWTRTTIRSATRMKSRVARTPALAITIQPPRMQVTAITRLRGTIVLATALPTKTKTASAMRLKLRDAPTVQRATTIQMLQMTTVHVRTLL